MYRRSNGAEAAAASDVLTPIIKWFLPSAFSIDAPRQLPLEPSVPPFDASDPVPASRAPELPPDPELALEPELAPEPEPLLEPEPPSERLPELELAPPPEPDPAPESEPEFEPDPELPEGWLTSCVDPESDVPGKPSPDVLVPQAAKTTMPDARTALKRVGTVRRSAAR